MNQNFTLVQVVSDDETTRDVVAAVVNSALKDRGFTNTMISDEKGEPAAHPSEESLLSLVTQNNPELFADPIVIMPKASSTEVRTSNADFLAAKMNAVMQQVTGVLGSQSITEEQDDETDETDAEIVDDEAVEI